MQGELIFGLVLLVLLILYGWATISDGKKQRQEKDDLKKIYRPKPEGDSMDSVKRANTVDSESSKLDYSARYIPPHGHEGFDDNW